MKGFFISRLHMLTTLRLVWISLFTCLLWCNGAAGQDACDWPGSKKDQKKCIEILEKGGSDTDKIESLTELSEGFTSSGKLWFELGKLQFMAAEKKETNDYEIAKKSLVKAEELCPKINPLLNYYLGIIYYSEKKHQESIDQFKVFLSYPTNPSDKYHYQKLMDVERSIPQIEQEKFKANAAVNVDQKIQPKKINKASTSKSEYLPVLSPDNQILLFTRKYSQVQRGMAELKEVEEFTLATRIDTGFVFDEGIKLEEPFNKGGNYGGASLTLTNKEMFLTVCLPTESGYKNCDIFYTRKEKFLKDTVTREMAMRWSKLINLGDQINAPDSWEAQPSISPDGKTLYYTKYGTTTQETDLYYSVKDSAGNWSKGEAITSLNSKGHDKAPFIHTDGKTLYFSSTGRKGNGGFDIYKTTGQGNSWSEPENIGYPINTSGDEHGLLVSTDGHYAVFATNTSNIQSGVYDLYYIELPQKVRPEEIVLIKGTLDSAKTETQLQLKDLDGNVIQDIQVDTDDGAYATVLTKSQLDQSLVLEVEQDGAAFEARIINPAKAVGGTIDNKAMQVSALKSNQPYTISDINFKTNSAEVLSESKIILNEFAKFLLKQASLKVEIRGHTDNVGDKIKNQELSIERALSVKQYLIQQGVPASRLSHRGFGDENPIDSNTSEKGRAKNRRTEFYVL